MGISGSCPATVGWFEITTTEPALCREFYQGLFGWEFTSFDAGSYQTITASGAAQSMGALRQGNKDTLCISVVCGDVAATIPRLESLGATVVEPPARTAAGDLHAVLTDVQANRLGLFEPGDTDSPRPPAVPVANALAWFEIGTTNLVATQKFYEESFDWASVRDEAAEGVAYYSIHPGASEKEIGGILDLSDNPGMTDYAIPGLLVPDVHELVRRCELAGGRRVMDPFSDAKGLVIGQFTDPFGNRWSAFALPSDG